MHSDKQSGHSFRTVEDELPPATAIKLAAVLYPPRLIAAAAPPCRLEHELVLSRHTVDFVSEWLSSTNRVVTLLLVLTGLEEVGTAVDALGARDRRIAGCARLLP